MVGLGFMMINPTLFPVDGRPIPGLPDHIVSTLSKNAEQIRVRTGCSSWYSTVSECVQYHPGDAPNGAPHQDLIFTMGRYLPINLDDTIMRIMMSVNTSWDHKLAIVERNKKAGKDRRREEINKITQDTMPEFNDRYKYLKRILEDPRSQRVFSISKPLFG